MGSLLRECCPISYGQMPCVFCQPSRPPGAPRYPWPCSFESQLNGRWPRIWATTRSWRWPQNGWLDIPVRETQQVAPRNWMPSPPPFCSSPPPPEMVNLWMHREHWSLSDSKVDSFCGGWLWQKSGRQRNVTFEQAIVRLAKNPLLLKLTEVQLLTWDVPLPTFVSVGSALVTGIQRNQIRPKFRLKCGNVLWRAIHQVAPHDMVRSHEERRCSFLGPTQSRISPTIL